MRSFESILVRVKLAVFGAIVIFGTSFSSVAFAGATEEQAVAFCVASGAVTPEAFAYCVGSSLGKAELKKCISKGRCFGVSFSAIRKYGICGGANSEMRKLFGFACGCGGPAGSVKIVNDTNQTVFFNVEGSCTDDESYSLAEGYIKTLTGAGDEWFNITVQSDGGTVSYGLDRGMTYALRWNGALLDVYFDTPRYNP